MLLGVSRLDPHFLGPDRGTQTHMITRAEVPKLAWLRRKGPSPPGAGGPVSARGLPRGVGLAPHALKSTAYAGLLCAEVHELVAKRHSLERMRNAHG
jgi:hypothetical protein